MLDSRALDDSAVYANALDGDVLDDDAPDAVVTAPDPGDGPVGGTRGSRLGGGREQAILRAAYELLAEVGYAGLRLDAVAARAKASKATLYRHWRGKPQLVADAIRVCHAAGEAIPDTGTLRGDLVCWFGAMAEATAGEDGPLLAGLVMAMHTDPELATELRALRSSKGPVARLICARAEARGELRPGYNPELIDEIVPGQLFMHRFAWGGPLDAAFIDHLVDDIILPLLTR
jgi:AcrR family transcriptional regulator